jgi:hypothetical protein
MYCVLDLELGIRILYAILASGLSFDLPVDFAPFSFHTQCHSPVFYFIFFHHENNMCSTIIPGTEKCSNSLFILDVFYHPLKSVFGIILPGFPELNIKCFHPNRSKQPPTKRNQTPLTFLSLFFVTIPLNTSKLPK